MTARRFWVLFGLLFLVSFGKRALTLCLGPAGFYGDSPQYWAMGTQVAAGDWLLLGSDVYYRTPLYPMFLGVFQYVFGEQALAAVVVTQHLLMLAANLLVALICWQTTRNRTATLLAYGLSVLCLTRSSFCNGIITEPLFTFLLTATVWSLSCYHRRPSTRWSAAFAILLGLTIMVRPVPKLLWLPLAAVCFLHATRWGDRRLNWQQAALHATCITVVLFAVLAPWYVRNWVRFGEPFLAKLPTVNKWQVCFQGGSAARLPMPDTPAGRRVLELIGSGGDVPDRYCYAAVGALAAKGLDQEEVDDLVSEVCLDAIREHPVEFAWATFKRSANFWRTEADIVWNGDRHRNLAGFSDWRVESVAAAYEKVLRMMPAQWWRWNETMAIVVACGIVLMLLAPGTRAFGVSLALMFMYFAAVTAAVEVENYKYRMILEPVFALVIACGFAATALRVVYTAGNVSIDLGRCSVEVRIASGCGEDGRAPRETDAAENEAVFPRQDPV